MGGAPKPKNVVAKKPRVGPSLGGPSTSTKASTPKSREAYAIMDDEDKVVAIPILAYVALTSATLTSPLVLASPTTATVALAPALSSAIALQRLSASA